MFFKSLTSRNADIVEIAKQGLKRVIQQQSLSKELLQSSLPILVNLAHYKNLTMPLLSGLERLLELLSNWFNPTLGRETPRALASMAGSGQVAPLRDSRSRHDLPSQGHQDRRRDDQPVPPPSSGGGQVPRTPRHAHHATREGFAPVWRALRGELALSQAPH